MRCIRLFYLFYRAEADREYPICPIGRHQVRPDQFWFDEEHRGVELDLRPNNYGGQVDIASGPKQTGHDLSVRLPTLTILLVLE